MQHTTFQLPKRYSKEVRIAVDSVSNERSLHTINSIEIATTIAVEDSYVDCVNKDNIDLICQLCWKHNDVGQPYRCGQCKVVKYCSKLCQVCAIIRYNILYTIQYDEFMNVIYTLNYYVDTILIFSLIMCAISISW